MPFVAPWLLPPDFMGAITRGSSLGESLRGQDIQNQQAADRLGLSYAQLAQSAAQHSASLAAEQKQTEAVNALRAQQAQGLQQYRQSQLANQQAREALAEQKAAEALKQHTDVTNDALGFLTSKVDNATGEEGPNLPDSELLKRYPNAINHPIVRQHLEKQAAKEDVGSGPVMADQVLDRTTKQPIPGWVATRGPRGARLEKVGAIAADELTGANLARARLSAIKSDLKAAQDALPLARATEKPALTNKIAQLTAARDAILQPKKKGKAPDDGKTLKWNPDTNDFE